MRSGSGWIREAWCGCRRHPVEMRERLLHVRRKDGSGRKQNRHTADVDILASPEVSTCLLAARCQQQS